MLVRVALVAAMVAASLAAPASAEEPLEGSFTAVALPFPYPFWNDLGHRCEAGIEPLHATVEPFAAPFDGLLTLSAEDLIGDWDLFVVAGDETLLAGSNRAQPATGTAGSEHLVTLLDAGDGVGMVACNQLGAPAAEVRWRFEPFDRIQIAADVAVGDNGGELNYYAPQDLTITAGSAVAWSVDAGTEPHTVTGAGDSFRLGTVIGGTAVHVFDTPGTYLYFCEFHGAPEAYPMTQTGRIVVV